MTQGTTALRSLLDNGWTYDLVQWLMAGPRTRRFMQREFIEAKAGDRVLDVGCGTADILSVLPDDVDYVGFDISGPYIARARARWQQRGRFYAQHLDRTTLRSLGKFDLVLATGLLHHLGDDEAGSLLEMLSESFEVQARIITVDGCFVERQNPVARFLIEHDRGKSVRTPDAYMTLARRSFNDVQGWLVHRAWPPYTHWIMRAQNPRAISLRSTTQS